MGLEVEEASDGLEALGRLRSRSYQLVVTDLEMPRLDGFELLAEMKRHHPLAAIPVIAASTKLDEKTRKRVLRSGPRHFWPSRWTPRPGEAVAPLFTRAGG